MLSFPGITWTSPYPNPISFLPPSLISMSTFDLNLASASPMEEEDTSNHADSCLSSSNLFTNLHQQIPNHCMTYPLRQFQQQQPKEFLFIAGSSDHPIPHRYVPTEEEDERASKWMPSKMRFMRKMMNSTHIVVSKARVSSVPVAEDQQLQAANGGFNPSNNSPPSGVIRVCSDCNTTKTPLWRSGPRGPKSLCNACGIRQRKARRAMAAAAAMNGGVLIPSHAPVKVRKEKKFDTDRTLPFKKRCKMNFTSNATPAKKLCFDDVAMSSNKNVQKVFPQEERDAAILLMALSCGIINSQLSAC